MVRPSLMHSMLVRCSLHLRQINKIWKYSKESFYAKFVKEKPKILDHMKETRFQNDSTS